MNQQVLAAQISAQSHRRVKVGAQNGLYVKSIALSGGTAESVMRVARHPRMDFTLTGANYRLLAPLRNTKGAVAHLQLVGGPDYLALPRPSVARIDQRPVWLLR
ncbi:hypothetical protein FHW79_005422 [Azospirillum sp. OGB3]|uniref:hypothetical protein n=1 Tax=Azospirillum sp. OGB3 TaxID=2587012 RepID=UPI0016062459|nr:hypothetical protein [Azospirillum sp. OGB3]MBB3267757.1 hypothetical protein [Azospirillum sp. OGB3]